MGKHFYAPLVLAAGLASAGCTPAGGEKNAGAEPKLLAAIVKGMAGDGTVLDETYNPLFKEGSARAGAAALIQGGRYVINGIPIPATADEFDAAGFAVNENEWLAKNADGSYTVDRADYGTYIDGALAIVGRLPAGLETRLYDTDGDGYADWADADYYDAIIVGDVVRNAGGTVTVARSSLENGLPYPENAGRAYDGAFDAIAVVDFDEAIQPGDVALLQRKSGGYRIIRAVEVRGVFTGGGDHQFYEIDGTRYEDAMRFSRDNIIISNRPGEYANVRAYFGFTGCAEPVSLWLSPVTERGRQGAPVSLTSGESAAFYLAKAAAAARERLSGADAPEEAEAELSAVIALAEQALEQRLPDDILDYHAYLLFLALHGSAGDIGAEYAGFRFAGFESAAR